MAYLFSYGTLQRSETQLRLFGRLLRGASDTLKGYKTADIVIADETFLAKEESRQLTAMASDGDEVNGKVFEVTTEELAMIDRYEPENYERILVKLDSGKDAWLYVAVD